MAPQDRRLPSTARRRDGSACDGGGVRRCFRVSDVEDRALMQAATSAGLTVSDLLRGLCADRVPGWPRSSTPTPSFGTD